MADKIVSTTGLIGTERASFIVKTDELSIQQSTDLCPDCPVRCLGLCGGMNSNGVAEIKAGAKKEDVKLIWDNAPCQHNP